MDRVARESRSVQGAERFVITGTGFSGEDRQMIRSLVQTLGAEYSGDLVYQRTTHLVCRGSIVQKGEKYTRAINWGIPVVNILWVVDCITYGEVLPVEKYSTFDGASAMTELAMLVEQLSELSVRVESFGLSAHLATTAETAANEPVSQPTATSTSPRYQCLPSSQTDTSICTTAGPSRQSPLSPQSINVVAEANATTVSYQASHVCHPTGVEQGSSLETRQQVQPAAESCANDFLSDSEESDAVPTPSIPVEMQPTHAEFTDADTASSTLSQTESYEASLRRSDETTSRFFPPLQRNFNASNTHCSQSSESLLVLKSLVRPSRGNTVRERHQLCNLKAVKFAEQIRVSSVGATLGTKDKKVCALIDGRAQGQQNTCLAGGHVGVLCEPLCLYQFENGEWWMECFRFYSASDVGDLVEQSDSFLTLPVDYNTTYELVRGIDRLHFPLSVLTGEMKVKKVKSGVGQVKFRGNQDVHYWRFAFDAQRVQLLTDRPVTDFMQ